MGNKCTCFNQLQDQQTCDLSGNNMPEGTKNVQKSQNHFESVTNSALPVSMIHGESEKKQKNTTYTYNNSTTMSSVVGNAKIGVITKITRGYLLRKKFKGGMKNQLEQYTDELYSKFVSEVAVNQNVNDALFKPPSKTYTTTQWSEFYETDPTVSIIEKIQKTKRYHNGLIMKYPDKRFTSDNITECLNNVEYIYKGEVDLMTNKRCGTGECTFRDGSQLYGTWYADEFTGWNRKIDEKGTLFVGLFKQGQIQGKGLRYVQSSNHLYKGEFVNGIREGKGVDISSGAKYEGDFKDDKKQGQGKITFESGDTYEGGFENNTFNGQGHYKWKKNGHEYIGEYVNGYFHGKGLYKWSEQEYYKGDYENGVKQGKGEVKYPDGKKFICPFVKGKPHGIGTYDDGKGKKCEVEFIQGKINKKYKPMKKKM